ncbi:MAG: hypothetical protein LBK95_15095 [Bifidobacteriaceae bacterium]|nr:hypothetical protein [Bifidobacteriaceae bacterium]
MRAGWAALASASAFAIAGCAGSDQIATMDGNSSTSADPASRQGESAEALAQCLRDVGIAASTVDWENGQKQLQLDLDEPYLVGFPDGSTMRSPSSSQIDDGPEAALMESMEKLSVEYANEPLRPYLMISGVDRSDVFDACIKQGGYTDPEYSMTPTQELDAKREVIDATAGWIECARGNGYPAMDDIPAPKADHWRTTPMALLPAHVTETDIRALIDACPTFDLAAAMARDKALAELDANATEDDVKALNKKYPEPVTPFIGFDLPGFDGGRSPAGSEPDQATRDRMAALTALLYEVSDTYFASRDGSPSG